MPLMGYRIPHPRHRRGKPCPACIRRLEIACEIEQRPQAPTGPGGSSR